MTMQRMKLGQVGVLVVDMQERLLPVMADQDTVLAGVKKLCAGAMALDVPLLFTEQYRKGLGDTVAQLHEAKDEAVREGIFSRGLRSVVVCGIETHVCVLQTCMDLAANGVVTGVCVDATGSRNQTDHDAAVQRMVQGGILPVTTESVLLELVREAGSERFKAVLPIIK